MKRHPTASAAPSPLPASPARDWLALIFCALFGAFLGLSLLKFGNPPIMEKWVTAPTNIWEFVLGYPWPIDWAYLLLAGLAVVGGAVALGKQTTSSPRPSNPLKEREKTVRVAISHGISPWYGSRSLGKVLLALPIAWLIWQIVAGTQSVEKELSHLTLKHFVACVACFYLGRFALARSNVLWPFWLTLLGGFLLVLTIGFQQHFGGLAETRQYFFQYIYPQLKEIPPEYLNKISKDRIWATLFYPNALAGVLLLLLPPLLSVIWRTDRLTIGAKGFVVAVVGLGALACLFWSGSKGGWLLMLLLGLIALLRVPMAKRFKVAIVSIVLIAGVAGFFVKYAGFFKKGATSVGARFDYWRAAVQTAKTHPIIGTGPGTFAIPYATIKKPESEMSRMVHNDYLEQASDSGLPGLLLYVGWVIGGLVRSYPRPGGAAEKFDDWIRFCIWLGVLGWALQSCFEFSFYIPALTWAAVAFMGWLLSLQHSVAEN